MRTETLLKLQRTLMGMTPGVWAADAAGRVHTPDGAAFVQTPGNIPTWQRDANAESVAMMLNHKAEIVAALELSIAFMAKVTEARRREAMAAVAAENRLEPQMEVACQF